MKCDICHENEAILHVRQDSSGKITELHLCSQCAEKRGFLTDANKLGLSLEGLLSGLMTNSNENKCCPVCGKKYSGIKKTQKAGCPECYNVFKNEIFEVMKKMGITNPYTGTMPNIVSNYEDLLTKRSLLQEKLNQAIEKEDYEKAAVYRDQLKLLNKDAVNEGESDE